MNPDIELIDQRIRLASARDRAAGTCVTRASTGPDADVLFDGSSVAMPVKVLGSVFVQPGDRCLLDRYGSDWVVTGSWSSLGVGEAAHVQAPAAPTATLTSTTFVDLAEIDAFAFRKAYDGTYVRMGLTAGAYSTTAGAAVRWAYRLTPLDAGSTWPAQDFPMGLLLFNTTNQHMSVTSSARFITIPAGSYQVQVRWRRTNAVSGAVADTNDPYSCELDEGVRTGAPIL